MTRILIVVIALLLVSPTLASLAAGSFPADSPRLATKTGFVGTQLIKRFEGFMPCRYIDAAGHPTIGYGHLITELNMPECISPERAHELLEADLRTAERCINHQVMSFVHQHHFDALSSFTFNLGCGNLMTSTLLRELNADDFKGAANEFPRWNKARVNGQLTVLRGLTLRRYAEKYVFED